MNSKWYGLASKAYKQAIDLCPTNGDYQLVLGHLHEVAGKPEEAEIAYLQAVFLDPNNAF